MDQQEMTKFLCLLDGPARIDEPQWWELSDYLPANQNEAKVDLLELAQAIKLLQRYSKDWSDDDIISVLEELTDIPEEWLYENVATLYLLCGEPVTVMMMGNKLLNGKITELTNLVAHLALVCQKHHSSMNWLMDLLDKVCEVTDNGCDKQKFIELIPTAFHDVTLDLYEVADLGNIGIKYESYEQYFVIKTCS
ncbi:F-box only protein 47-like [Tachypleus tridentatus]|uniref:F-box only protein 47-like n=1 Tax=Tachypleus tridentatus TaxID=6853 RepID=UPI003FD1E753